MGTQPETPPFLLFGGQICLPRSSYSAKRGIFTPFHLCSLLFPKRPSKSCKLRIYYSSLLIAVWGDSTKLWFETVTTKECSPGTCSERDTRDFSFSYQARIIIIIAALNIEIHRRPGPKYAVYYYAVPLTSPRAIRRVRVACAADGTEPTVAAARLLPLT